MTLEDLVLLESATSSIGPSCKVCSDTTDLHTQYVQWHNVPLLDDHEVE
jgi:hypothetical protein